MSGEWKGWQTWTNYKSAGLVDDTLDFSEEPIIVDHAVGRTKKAIGQCWPMDAAVAYSLMKAGPNAGLTWTDLVNQHTKAAAVLMTRKVAYGRLPSPDVKSCGHDEVNASVLYLGAPRIGLDNILDWDTSSWSNLSKFSRWLDDNNVSEDHPARACQSFRVNETQAAGINYRTVDLLTTDFFTPVVELIKELNPDWTGNYKNDSFVRKVEYTRGVCKWGGDPEKKCSHHDSPMETDWWLVREDDGFMTAFTKGSTYGGWNGDQWRHVTNRSIPAGKNVVRWSEVQRSMSAAVPDDEVIQHIKKSLLRMLKRNDNIVAKEGRGKTAKHSWSDWSWLAEMTAHVKQTNSKKRKENEIANGWVYTKVNSRRSYGHEIAEFVWHPQNEIKDFMIGRREKDDWSVHTIMRNLRFSTKAQAEAFAEAIMAAHAENGGHFAHRQHSGFEKSEVSTKWSIRSITVSDTLVMKGSVDPEDYMTPEEFMTLYRNAAPVVINEHRDNFTRLPNWTIKAAPEEVKTDGGE